MLASRDASLQTTIAPTLFAHRELSDGSVDSICMNCFLPISRSGSGLKITERELVAMEAAHRCEGSSKAKRL
jgi:hypothetical protein